METFKVIKCPNCGGAMYSDQKTASYQCPYCNFSLPWSEENYYRALPLEFRHKPVEQVEGLLKLGLVDVMTPAVFHDEGVLQRNYRLKTVDEKLALWDTATTQAFAGIFQVKFTCPFCGGTITGDSNQNIYTCQFCGNKLGAEEALRPGAYQKEFIMGVGAERVPASAIPFLLQPEEAQSAALALIHAYPEDFAGQDLEKRIRETMTAVYVPFFLADLSLKTQVDSDLGEFQSYQEIINWACPDTTLYDIYLLDHLDPWDFGQVTAFDPSFMEGIFRVASVANNISRNIVIDNLLAERLPCDLQATFPLKKAQVCLWGRDFRKHSHANFLLPIYYVDSRTEDQSQKSQIRLAVNGQTGQAAGVILQEKKPALYRIHTSRNPRPLSAESTVRMPPRPIRKIKAPFLHQVLPLNQALKKNGLAKLFSWFSGN